MATIDLTVTPPRIRGRALHLVDLENLLGDPDACCSEVEEVLESFILAAAVGPDDLVKVAVNHRLYRKACLPLDRGWDIKLASGPDAADHVLLDAAPLGWVTERFDRLVVGSGDGIFEGLVRDVRRRAVPVWVVSQDRCLSRSLASAASRVVPLSRPTLLPAA
jgi:NYN domain